MNILWITGRELGKDLASSTENGLFKALFNIGHNVHMISPSKNENLENGKFANFDYININGLRTFTGGYFLRKFMLNDKRILQNIDFAVIDWRYVSAISSLFDEENIPWFIIDRGPPAYKGFFTQIQKIMWRRAWIISSRKSSGGFVVSSGHKKKVLKYSKKIKIEIINAGVELKLFDQEPKEIKEKIKMIYCGRIDKKRGLAKIDELFEKRKFFCIPSEIHIIGEGDCADIFKKKSEYEEALVFHDKLNRNEVYEIMKTCHIGIMPMPNKEIWRIASPLKLSEYAAAGLIVIGNNHQGNRFEGKIHEWSKLQDGDNWVDSSIDEINKIIKNGTSKDLSRLAIKSSEQYSWEFQAKKIINLAKINT